MFVLLVSPSERNAVKVRVECAPTFHNFAHHLYFSHVVDTATSVTSDAVYFVFENCLS